ncbi:hypothetical protein [Calothrix sp. PCC 6303]|uniref:hypothetical protein n=1 Tax=Calothrix sp. PCC 6303 TaxID=1170562 RepID=UPI0002A05274|nr:hypothetical protein [Calothrix sp. PCC 6303]AFZ01986.1 hypothetical protein Cal6303_3039 [Calothrix sp. PCC 6303]
MQIFENKLGKLFCSKLLTATGLVLMVTSTGCSQKTPPTQLEIKNVQSVDSQGTYKVTGSTNLPDSSKIAIAAVRYLRPTQTQQVSVSNSETDINRSILVRQFAKVKGGQWEADLNIWQVSPDGRYQEAWQTNQSQIQLTPENDISFIATFDPQSQLVTSETSEQTENQSIDEKTEKQPLVKNLEGKSLRFTNEGEKYIQASQVISVAIPTAKTTPPGLKPEDINGGWGNRFQIQSQSTSAGITPLPLNKSRKTDAPLTPAEFLR